MAKDTRSDDEKAKDVLKRFAYLQQIRQDYETSINECIEFTAHDLQLIDQTENQGQKTGTTVYDGTAISAANLMADGLYGHLVSPAYRWLGLTLPVRMGWSKASNMRGFDNKRLDEVPEVRMWLEAVEEVMYSDLRASNFYEAVPSVFRQGCTVGTVDCYAERDINSGKVFFFVPHIREVYIAQDQFGRVDTVYRKYELTYREMVRKFGMNPMKECILDIEDKYNKKPYEKEYVIHAVYPRSDYDITSLNAKNKPISSMWVVESGIKKLVMESGYTWNPHTVWRWYVNSNEWYGRSPAWFAMVDILTAQQQAKTNLRAGHMAVDPPYAVMEAMRGKINLNPGGRTYMQRLEQKPEILDTNSRALPIGIDFQERTQKAIEEHFHVDFFLMLSRAAFEKIELTATQVMEMQAEKAAVLGTRIGRIQSEFLNPLIDNVFEMESRSGMLPPPPDILYEFGGARMEVDYLGLLAQAQKKMAKMQNMSAGLNALAPLVSMFPQAGDIIEPDQTGIEILKTYNFPMNCLRSEEQVAAIRGQRSSQMQDAQATETMGEVANAVPKLSKPIDEKSALGLLLGGTV